MKAAIVTSAGKKPTYGDFHSPVGHEGLEVITVTAAALTNLAKGRAAGTHYRANNHYPFVPGVDGVGTFYLHLKESEFRFNQRQNNLYKVLLSFLRKDPL